MRMAMMQLEARVTKGVAADSIALNVAGLSIGRRVEVML